MRDKILCIQIIIVFCSLFSLQQTCSEKFNSQSVTMPKSTRSLLFLYFLVVFGKISVVFGKFSVVFGIYHRPYRVPLLLHGTFSNFAMMGLMGVGVKVD